MPKSFALTHLLNQLFGGILASGLRAVGMPADKAATQAAATMSIYSLELLVAGGLILFFLIVRLTLSVEKPNPVQQVAEIIHEVVGDLGDQVIGHGYERFQAFVTCVGLFVLCNNLLGLIPRVVTPTSQPYVPLGIAVLTFLYYNFHGFRVHKLGYIKQFLGPLPWWVIPMTLLMLIIEVISHLARMMSLTIRLYANMFASDLMTLVAFSLIPIALPAGFLALHALVSVIQAFIFMLLAMIYLSMAVSHDH